jgi:aryl-alcohol dehydrogenase-like predicted oxidoreductase
LFFSPSAGRACGNRDELFLATKVGGAPGEDLSRTAIRSAVEGSLGRLDTDHIDLYYAHVDHRSVALEETLEAFDELVTAGKVRHIGCSNYAARRTLAYSPLLSGSYTVPDRGFPAQYLGADSDARAAVLEGIASEVGASANQVVLAWLMAITHAAIPLIAASNATQLDENLGALEVALSPEQVARLDAASA